MNYDKLTKNSGIKKSTRKISGNFTEIQIMLLLIFMRMLILLI